MQLVPEKFDLYSYDCLGVQEVSQNNVIAIKKDILILCNFLFTSNTENLDVYNENKRIDTWNAFNSLLVQPPVRTNHGVVAPLLCSPPNSPQTLHTALCLAQKINSHVLRDGRSTVIALDLDLYEHAVKIRANTWNKRKLILSWRTSYVCTIESTWKIH